MMEPAIRIEQIGKRYRIGAGDKRSRYQTLREALAGAAAASVRRLRGQRDEHDATEFWALEDVTFDVSPGEVVGVIGRNGAGKSTLLKILSRITRPTRGQVELRGRVGSLLEVGTGFHPELTGRENIYLNGSILGMARREIDRQFDAIVAFSEVGRFLDTPVKRYSSGMYVRLAFAVAAHLEPEILIVDEVLAVGDAAFQKKCLGRIADISRAGRTVLFVSHTMPSVVSLCDRAVWLDRGRMRMAGPSRKVVDEYLTESLAPSTAAVSLREIPREPGTTWSARLTALEWITPLPLRNGEEMRARLHYETTSGLEEAAFGLGFCTPEGTRLLTLDSDFAAPRRSLPTGSQGWIELRCPELPLAPGRYSLDFGLRSGDRASDYLPGAALVEVIPGTKTPTFVLHHPGAGVRLGGEWVWE